MLEVDDYRDFLEVDNPSDLLKEGHRILRLPPEPGKPWPEINVAWGTPQFLHDLPTPPVELYVVKIPNAIVLPRKVIIETERSRLAADSFRKEMTYEPDLTPYGISTQGNDWSAICRNLDIRHLRGHTYIAGSTSSAFGHVLLEALSTMWAYKDFEESVSQLVVNKNFDFEFILEGLAARKRKMVRMKGPRFCESLIVPAQSLILSRAMSDHYVRMVQQIADHTGRQAKPERLFVSRRNIGKRQLLNQAEVETEFVRHGFRIVCPETMTFREQVEAFAATTFVAGPVGSGLYNSVFCRPGTQRIILAPDCFYTPNDLLIQHILQVPARYVFGPSERGVRPEGMFATWTVDLEGLRQVLRATF